MAPFALGGLPESPVGGRDEDPGLAEVVGAVLDGRISYDTGVLVLTRIPEDVNALVTRREDEIVELVGTLAEEHSALRVRDTSRLAAAVARVVAPALAAPTLVMGAVRLVDLHAYDEAWAVLDDAEPQESDDEWVQLYVRQIRLHVLVQWRRHADVDAALDGLLTDADRLGARGVAATVLLERATSLAERGRIEDALNAARAARALRAELAPEEEITPLLASRPGFATRCGIVARQAGAFEEALAIFEAGRADAVAENNRAEAAYLLSEAGFTWNILGDRVRSAEILERAAAEADALGRPDWSANWRTELREDGRPDTTASRWQRANAILQRHPDRMSEAVDLFRASVADARRRQDTAHEGDARSNLAAALERLGQPLQAELAFRAAIRCAQRIDDKLREMRYRTNLALHFVRVNRLEQAEEELAPALEIGEQLRSAASSTEMRQTVSVALAVAYDVAVLAAGVSYKPGKYMVAEGQTPTWRPPRPDLLFEVGQRSRAANFLESLRVGALVEGIADDGSGELTGAVLGVRAAEVAVELAAAESSPLALRIAERDAAATRLRSALGRRTVELAGAVGPLSLRELEAHLGPDEVLVDLLTTEDGVAFLCVRPGAPVRCGFFGWKTEDRRRLLHRLGRFRREALAADYEGAADDRADTLAALDDELTTFNQVLLTDVAEEIAGLGGGPPSRLFVSPENELFQLPFWRLAALVRPDKAPAVSVLPAPAALPMLKDRRRTGGRPWIAYADPSRSLLHSRSDVPDEAGFEWSTPRPEALVAQLPTAGRVHLACHGVFNARSTHRSGLVVAETGNRQQDPLGAPHPSGTAGLALFTAAQIVGRLFLRNCSLAVLAACNSGLPREHEASEFTGLPGAFLVAGARNVVASLWPAHDGAAALLMACFYGELDDAAAVPDVAAALARARATLAGLTRTEVVERIGELGVPAGDRPFRSSLYTDCFQHYGVD